MAKKLDVDYGPQDYLDGTYETKICTSGESPICGSNYGTGSEECQIQVVMPRTGISPAVRDECVAVAHIIKLVAAESPKLNVCVKDPTDFKPPASELPAPRVLIRDQRHLRNASLIVVVANGPSSGMGVESCSAVSGTIPRMLIYRSGTEISSVLLARIAPTVNTIEYRSLEDLKSQVREMFPAIVSTVMESQRRRRKALNVISAAKLPSELFYVRMLKDRTLASLEQETDIPESELRELERDPKAWANSSIVQIQRLAHAFGTATFSFSGDGATSFWSNVELLPEGIRKSLENLYIVLRDDGKWVPCDQVLQSWKGYREEVNYLPDEAETVELRGKEYPVWDQATWSERLRAAGDKTLFGDI